ncbi:hypothetical protein [Haloferula sp. A504]|uniref:hypothetical protein n=1 Tax=Haloferula sp. A504 TaxID=3373601 RepID=UPI0031C1AABA|nr:hypothetical protein [Verrucomicrobiaceae bacterium E54]
MGIFLFPLAALAGPSARLETPTTEAWTGQRIAFFIELHAPGTFDGAASFDIPRMPQSVVLKTGNPVLGSVTEGDTEYFTQRHEFALFSQAQGEVELPPITARFAHKKGYTGPSYEAVETIPTTRFTIRRPPGSEHLDFLVTTESLEINERWDPEPGPVETGAVFKRIIIQRASDITGIALHPAPTDEIEGIRTYAGDAEISDRTDRGTLNGERRETLTYLVREPGLHTLPAIRYDWWNPETRSLESKTLPGVSFTATAPPPTPPQPSRRRHLWWAIPLAVAVLLVRFRHRLRDAIQRCRDCLDPPDRRAARRFLRACRRHQPARAAQTWSDYQAVDRCFQGSREFHDELLALRRISHGPGTAPRSWRGDRLATAFRASRVRRPRPDARSPLPGLNI